jgi:hypothetical protein
MNNIIEMGGIRTGFSHLLLECVFAASLVSVMYCQCSPRRHGMVRGTTLVVRRRILPIHRHGRGIVVVRQRKNDGYVSGANCFSLKLRCELFPTCRNHTSRLVGGLHTCTAFAPYLAFCVSDPDHRVYAPHGVDYGKFP